MRMAVHSVTMSNENQFYLITKSQRAQKAHIFLELHIGVTEGNLVLSSVIVLEIQGGNFRGNN